MEKKSNNYMKKINKDITFLSVYSIVSLLAAIFTMKTYLLLFSFVFLILLGFCLKIKNNNSLGVFNVITGLTMICLFVYEMMIFAISVFGFLYLLFGLFFIIHNVLFLRSLTK